MNQIYNTGFQQNLLRNDSADIIVTSPPYKNTDNYSEDLMYSLAEEAYRILKPNSLFFLNFGSLAEDKLRPFNVLKIMTGWTRFKLNDTIIWVKNHFTPLKGNKRLNNLTEFIFLLYKGEMPDLNRLSIGIPYKDKSNAKRFNNGLDLRCGGNIWYIDYPTVQKSEAKLHKDMFPLELPERCIKLSNIPKNSLVVDFFAGSGTTCLAARNLGMNYVGYEINPTHYKTAMERLK